MPPQTWPPTSSRRGHLVPLECKKNLSAPRAPPQILLGELAALLYTPSWWGWGCLPPSPRTPSLISALWASALAPHLKEEAWPLPA